MHSMHAPRASTQAAHSGRLRADRRVAPVHFTFVHVRAWTGCLVAGRYVCACARGWHAISVCVCAQSGCTLCASRAHVPRWAPRLCASSSCSACLLGVHARLAHAECMPRLCALRACPSVHLECSPGVLDPSGCSKRVPRVCAQNVCPECIATDMALAIPIWMRYIAFRKQRCGDSEFGGLARRLFAHRGQGPGRRYVRQRRSSSIRLPKEDSSCWPHCRTLL